MYLWLQRSVGPGAPATKKEHKDLLKTFTKGLITGTQLPPRGLWVEQEDMSSNEPPQGFKD